MSETPHTGVEESDPNADSARGLAGGPEGGMGVSSERPGPIRGKQTDVSYDHAPTLTERDDDAATEPGEEAARPDPVEPHRSDPDRNPRHGV